jgi:hypothetical protein
MSFQCSLEGRQFSALLNGISKRRFHNEASFTNEFLVEQLYAGQNMESDAVIAEIATFDDLFRKLANEHADASKLEALLGESALSADNQKILVNFWSKEREKIHESMATKSRWNSTFKQLGWRVDSRAASRNVAEINEPVAIFELNTNAGKGVNSESSSMVVKAQKETVTEVPIRFEMNRAQVNETLGTLLNIRKVVDDLSY